MKTTHTGTAWAASTAACVAALLLALSSCAVLQQTVKITPLDRGLPVSATGSLFVDGATIDASGFQVVKEFTYDKAFSAKLKQKEVELMLSEDLAKLVREAGGDAIVNLRIATLRIVTNDLTWVWFERYMGTLAITGGLVYLLSPMYFGGSASTDFVLVGAALAGGGAALIGGSFLHESLGSSNYSFRISGTVVKL